MRFAEVLTGVGVFVALAWLCAGAGRAQTSEPSGKPAQPGRSAPAPQQPQASQKVPTTAKGRTPSQAERASARPARKSTSRAAERKAGPSRASAAADRAARRQMTPARPSYGQRAGLHGTSDPLDLKSSVALVVDQDTQQVLFSKNPDAVLPIASITKLMTAMVVLESGLPLDERLSISQEDVDTEKGSGSRLRVGSSLSRGDMLHLALMASENRAAHALGRHFPGGLDAFVAAMNRKAQSLGMVNTRYVEPTGLSSGNQASAHDLTLLVHAASDQQLIRDLSTTANASVTVGSTAMQFRNTNGLIRNPSWEIGLQKTGYISEAGRCVVMQAQMAGRKLIMVLLDSAGRYSRIGDAERLRAWITQSLPAAQAGTVTPPGG